MSDRIPTCRTCHALVHWVTTDKGKKMPIDYDPVADGKFVRVPGTFTVRALLRDEHPPEGTPRYHSHFSTCPDRQEHRK